jgi:uncharacterized protein
MQTRTLGRTGIEVSAISLGTEYLIDLPQDHVDAVIHHAIERGINYFDLFWAQPGFRDIMGRAFQGHRDKVLLTAHLGATVENGQGARTRDPIVAREYIEDYLRRYNTDYVDVLFLHNSDGQEDYDAVMAPGGLLDMAQRLQQKGVARTIGFSGHTVSTARQAAESGAIDVIMFPVNLAANAVPGKREFLQACAAHDVALVAMKPYAGGKLLRPESNMSLMSFQSGGDDMELTKERAITPIQCLHYVLSQVGISTIVPGCKDIDELDQALSYWEADDEARDFSQLLAAFAQYQVGECVYCNHCLPCPSYIDIGQVNRLLDMGMAAMTPAVQEAYAALHADADDCIQCAACEERCPFDVAVIERMEQAAELFA